MVRATSRESQKRTIYAVAGALVGIAIMVVPALCVATLGQTLVLGGLTSEFQLDTRLPAAYAAASPVGVFMEVLWLVLPALIIILALYWLAVHRTRWAGYDEAAKWSRR